VNHLIAQTIISKRKSKEEIDKDYEKMKKNLTFLKLEIKKVSMPTKLGNGLSKTIQGTLTG